MLLLGAEPQALPALTVQILISGTTPHTKHILPPCVWAMPCTASPALSERARVQVEMGSRAHPPLTYLTRCSMNLTEQFLFLKNPISEASANTTHTSRYRKQTHAWLWWYKAIPDTSSCALRLTHRQLLCLAATHKYNTAKEGRQTLVKHTRRCHVSFLTRCVRETGGQKHCILI